MSYESKVYDVRDSYCVPTTLPVFAPISFPVTLRAMPKSDIFGFISMSNKTLLALSSGMGAPLHFKPFHGPTRYNTFVPLLVRICGYPVGSMLRVNSPGAGSLSLFHAERSASIPGSVTFKMTEDVLEESGDAEIKRIAFLSLSKSL
uniref:Uncharacterized protein n=1 Tax=Solanum lycopersicum TaxID=4081 RepID=A0A3Q7G8E9_SOLLC